MAKFSRPTVMRVFRGALKLTQEQFAERVNISTSFVGHIERGEKLASLETVARICEALNVPLDYIVLGRRNDCARERCPLYLELVELTERYGNQP